MTRIFGLVLTLCIASSTLFLSYATQPSRAPESLPTRASLISQPPAPDEVQPPENSQPKPPNLTGGSVAQRQNNRAGWIRGASAYYYAPTITTEYATECDFDAAAQEVRLYTAPRRRADAPPPLVTIGEETVVEETVPDTYSLTVSHKLMILGNAAGLRQIDRLQSILGTLKMLCAHLDRLSVMYWVDAGSLLGLYRHQGIIPWDVDGDIAIPCNEFEKFVRLLKEHPLPSTEHVIILRAGGHRHAVAAKVVDKRTGFYVDILKRFVVGDKLKLIWPDSCPRCFGYPIMQQHSNETIFPLQRCFFEDFPVWCPSRVAEYLAEWYRDVSIPKNRRYYDPVIELV